MRCHVFCWKIPVLRIWKWSCYSFRSHEQMYRLSTRVAWLGCSVLESDQYIGKGLVLELPRRGSNPGCVTPGKVTSFHFWYLCTESVHPFSCDIWGFQQQAHHQSPMALRLHIQTSVLPFIVTNICNICSDHPKSSRKHSVLCQKLYVRGDLDITLAHTVEGWRCS